MVQKVFDGSQNADLCNYAWHSNRLVLCPVPVLNVTASETPVTDTFATFKCFQCTKCVKCSPCIMSLGAFVKF